MERLGIDTKELLFTNDALINTDDAAGKRIRVEHANLVKAIDEATGRHEALISSYNATFAYRVGSILTDPTVTLPRLPQWGSESGG